MVDLLLGIDWPTDRAFSRWESITAILIFIALVIGGSLRWGGRVRAWVRRRIERRVRTRPPHDTLRAVAVPGSLRWGDGTASGHPATQVMGQWFVTNTMTEPKRDLVIARVRLVPPLLGRRRMDADLSELDSLVRPTDRIPPGATVEVHGLFWITPPAVKPGNDFHAIVELTDQFANRHRLTAQFRAPRPLPPTTERKREQLSAIDDEIEKAVASVLQAELARYEANGRREGGLGSVTARYRETQLQGAGGNVGHERGTTLNHLIVSDPEEASITSDNADALEALHASLTFDGQRERFRSALAERVDKQLSYAPIAYLPLLVSLDLGFAPELLEVARAKLLGDADYGFSNCILLLSGMLRLRHPVFPDELLDSVEEFVHDAGEYPANIPERIAAIRAMRLRGG